MKDLFLNKRTYINGDGEEMINMCIPSLNMDKLTANTVAKLNQSHNGRIDNFVYQSVSKDIDEGIDATLYCNHIFNPFAVQEDDLVYTPVQVKNLYQKRSEPELPDGTLHSSSNKETEKMSYAKTVEYLARLGLGVV